MKGLYKQTARVSVPVVVILIFLSAAWIMATQTDREADLQPLGTIPAGEVESCYPAATTRAGSPTIEIAFPQEGANIHEEEILIGGNALAEAGISKVEARVNGGDWITAVGDSAWSARVRLDPGTNTIEARVIDVDGGEGTSKVTLQYTPKETEEGGFPVWIIILIVVVVVVVVLLIILYEVFQRG